MVKPRRLPKTLSQASARALLEQNGWVRTLGGKHVVKMEKAGHRPITLPYHKGAEWGVDLTRRILREAGLLNPGGQEVEKK